MDFDDPIHLLPPAMKPYFVWSTNASPHKNHIHAAEGLLQYCAEGGKLNTVITGFDVEQFNTKLTKDLEITHPNVVCIQKKRYGQQRIKTTPGFSPQSVKI